jgi:putative oxidoreductase
VGAVTCGASPIFRGAQLGSNTSDQKKGVVAQSLPINLPLRRGDWKDRRPLERLIHVRFCNFAAHLGATHVEHPAHRGGIALHGTRLRKNLDFPHQSTHVPYAPFTLNPGLQGLLEFVGGLLLALGFFTRTVAFVLAGNMAVACFMVHAKRGFFPLLNGGELAIVYCFVFLYFWLAGGGEWSLDRLRASTPVSSVSPRRA